MMLSGNKHARVRSGSLFCAPPPGDDAASFLLEMHLPQVSPESDDGGVIRSIETQCSGFGSQWTTPSRELHRATCSFTKPERSHQLVMFTRPRNLSQWANERGRSHTANWRGRPAMALRGDSHHAPSSPQR